MNNKRALIAVLAMALPGLSVFAQRYHGPGEPDFKKRNYPEGLNSIRSYLDKNKDKAIILKGTQWK